MKPLHPERLDTPGAQKALSVNRKTKEEILAAPDQKIVWNQFVAWVNRFNPKRNFFGAPIACGKNIRRFDYEFMHVLNELHCPNGKKQLLFNRIDIDLEDFIFSWFENDNEFPNMKMDTLREYFGMSADGAHDALVDVRQTGELVMKFLNLHRTFQRRTMSDGSKFIKFKDSCKKS
jgi:DNA polymerase III epsilon subunit-like protein